MMYRRSVSADRSIQAADSTAMRCLVVVPSLMRAGAETQAVELSNGLAARGHEVHLCSFAPQVDLRDRISSRVCWHHVPRRSKYDLKLVSRLSRIIDSEGIEVVQGVLQFATLVAWLAARKSARNPPVVAAVHTTIQRGLKEELQDRLVYRRIMRRLPAVVFVCEYQRDHWIAKYPELEETATVVHNGVAQERFQAPDFRKRAQELRSELGIPEGAFLFSCVAGFRPEKGHGLLLEAFSRTKGDAYLAFAGDGKLRAEAEARAAASGIAPRTRFLGGIPDTRPLIAASNATVLASTAVETFSMAMLESMALGVPMVAPRIGGLPEAIVHGETGLLFPVGDVQALAVALQRAVDNPGEMTKLGANAERKVVEAFTLEKMVAGSERVLRDVIAATRVEGADPDSAGH